MLVNAEVLKKSAQDVGSTLQSSVQGMSRKSEVFFKKNPIACVAGAFLLGIGAALLAYSVVGNSSTESHET